MPIIMVATRDNGFAKVQNAIHQVTARKGLPVLVVTKNDPAFFTNVPCPLPLLPVPESVDCLQGIINIIPFQLLSYHIAVERGFNVDQPRNLAKSVTVE